MHDRRKLKKLNRKTYNYIRFMAFEKCEHCGVPEGEFKHCIHHKDRDIYNNDASNLMYLCQNCHAEIEKGEYRRYRLLRMLKKFSITNIHIINCICKIQRSGDIYDIISKFLIEKETNCSFKILLAKLKELKERKSDE